MTSEMGGEEEGRWLLAAPAAAGSVGKAQAAAVLQLQCTVVHARGAAAIAELALLAPRAVQWAIAADGTGARLARRPAALVLLQHCLHAGDGAAPGSGTSGRGGGVRAAAAAGAPGGPAAAREAAALATLSMLPSLPHACRRAAVAFLRRLSRSSRQGHRAAAAYTAGALLAVSGAAGTGALGSVLGGAAQSGTSTALRPYAMSESDGSDAGGDEVPQESGAARAGRALRWDEEEAPASEAAAEAAASVAAASEEEEMEDEDEEQDSGVEDE